MEGAARPTRRRVCDPLSGSGPIRALRISPGPGLHAQTSKYGRERPSITFMISTRSHAGLCVVQWYAVGAMKAPAEGLGRLSSYSRRCTWTARNACGKREQRLRSHGDAWGAHTALRGCLGAWNATALPPDRRACAGCRAGSRLLRTRVWVGYSAWAAWEAL